MPLPAFLLLLTLCLSACRRAATPPGVALPPPHAQPAPAARPALSETQKIEKLLTALEASDAVFIRNGSEYAGKRAADHLRRKWKSAGDQVRTAEQFVELLASTSSSSGKPYFVKDEKGRVESAVWFARRLREIEAGNH